ncbi:MAG: ribose transport system substrate-binding protein [Oceanotoga sp.]|uniref:sugar ABC transporter substrate-binding protein n=1 Tax=Oceanotoga sp. TaxID=2108366 RepID=UPI00264EEA6B|nr:substrate-binding domain-containing protein [Oceanotoga sp.]MDN5342753.1 ribose transport system substrate-binding protein [Oceanotoga sp.]
MKKFITFFIILSLSLLVFSGNSMNKSRTIALSVSSMNNGFFVGLEKGVRDRAEELQINYVLANANGSVMKQLSDIEDLITQNVDALIVNALDGDAIIPAVKKANKAGIPILFLDRGANSTGMTCFIETDNVAMGRMAGEYIVRRLIDRYGKPIGNIVELEGLQGVTPTRDRGKGFNEVIEKYPDINIIARQNADFDQEKALNVMQNILQANSKIDAVFGHNDDNTIGAMSAIEMSGRSKPIDDEEHIILVGIDGIAQALYAVRKEKIDVSITQTVLDMGKTAVDLAIDKLDGKFVPPHVYTDFFIVDKNNADDEKLWGNIIK